MGNDRATELAEAMDALALILRQPAGNDAWSDRMQFWADWVSTDAKRVRAGDYGRVEHFLSAFGGMGSINDLNVGTASETIEDLKDRAWQLADAIRRREATT